MRKTGFTLVELLVVLAIISILAGMLLPGLSRAREAARRVNCASNLRQVGLSFKMYADESNGNFPTLQRFVGDHCDIKNTGVLQFDGRSLFPEYLTEARVLLCTSGSESIEAYQAGRWNRPDGPGGSRVGGTPNPCLFDQLSYFYLGWILRSEWIEEPGTGDASINFRERFANLLAGPDVGVFDQSWQLEDEFGQVHRVLRLREGIERFLITDINNPSASAVSQSSVPIFFDRIDIDPMGFNHVPGGGNVLYMDGHVAFVRYPGPFPISRAWASAVNYLGM